MTKKSIKKREVEVVQIKSSIEIFCETYESRDTRNNYLTTLNRTPIFSPRKERFHAFSGQVDFIY